MLHTCLSFYTRVQVYLRFIDVLDVLHNLHMDENIDMEYTHLEKHNQTGDKLLAPTFLDRYLEIKI